MICLLGIAGSGKTTQAKLLIEALHCPLVYTGDLLRKYATGEARRQVEAGELVDDSVTIPLLEAELERQDAQHKECVLDGSPRSMEQAEWVGSLNKAGKVKVTAVIHLVLDKPTAIERLRQRGRTDDKDEEVIEARFQQYEGKMGPVLAYLRQNGLKIIDIDAGQGIEKMHADIMKGLNAAKK